MSNPIRTLAAMVGKKKHLVVGVTMYVPVVIIEVFDEFASEFGQTLVEIVPLDSALQIESLTFEQTEGCLAEVKAEFGSTWVIYSDLV